MNGIFLMSVVLFIYLQTVERILEPKAVGQPLLVLIVGVLGMVCNIIGLIMFGVSRIKKSNNLQRDMHITMDMTITMEMTTNTTIIMEKKVMITNTTIMPMKIGNLCYQNVSQRV